MGDPQRDPMYQWRSRQRSGGRAGVMAVELEYGVALAVGMTRRHKNDSQGRANSHKR